MQAYYVIAENRVMKGYYADNIETIVDIITSGLIKHHDQKSSDIDVAFDRVADECTITNKFGSLIKVVRNIPAWRNYNHRNEVEHAD